VRGSHKSITYFEVFQPRPLLRCFALGENQHDRRNEVWRLRIHVRLSDNSNLSAVASSIVEDHPWHPWRGRSNIPLSATAWHETGTSGNL
jgi:hypothetical protein